MGRANDFEHIGVMIDNSRNAVMNLPTVKKMIAILEKLGFNTLMLYTEDTYEVERQPYFGYLRGRYSKAELKELDAYAAKHGVELIPCIQTLAHLNAIMRWPQYAAIRDTNDILCVGEEKVYELIEDMFATLAECFTSRVVNVGMDEAEALGLGNYLKKHGYQKRLEILGNHLLRVSQIADRYGFTLCMWSDMFYKLLTGSFYGDKNVEISEEQAAEVAAMIPENVRLIYWDYWKWEPEHFDKHIQIHQKFAKDLWYAGALWNWVGFAPHNAFTIDAMETAVASCRKGQVRNMIFTMWGDDGAECARFSLLPSLYMIACNIRGITDEAERKHGFEELFGIAFDDFMLLDFPGTTNDRLNNNADKYLLYNDPFLGILDMAVTEDDGDRFGACVKRLEPFTAHAEWGYLFESAKCLCEVLEIKANLGQRTRKAYQEEDREALLELLSVYEEVIRRTERFYHAYEQQWMIENKPHGFEVQDIRLGGLIQRMKHCAKRLQEFVSGERSELPELSEHLLDPFGNGETYEPHDFCVNSWREIASVNII